MPAPVLDSRSELVFEVHELGRRAGNSKKVHRVVTAGEDIGIAVIGVPPGSPIDLDLLFESVVEGVLVTGNASFQLRGECANCLEEIASQGAVDICELFVYPGKEDGDPDASRIEGEYFDLEPILRDQVVLELPFAPLCRPECAGLCPQCGVNLNREPEHQHDEDIDPRWSVLASWKD